MLEARNPSHIRSTFWVKPRATHNKKIHKNKWLAALCAACVARPCKFGQPRGSFLGFVRNVSTDGDQLRSALCRDSRAYASACIVFHTSFLIRPRATFMCNCGALCRISDRLQPRRMPFASTRSARAELDAQNGFRFWFRGPRKSGSRASAQIHVWS